MIDRKSEKIDGSIEVLNSFQITAATAGLDKASKAALHNIEVIATILKNAVPEYRDYTKEEIMGFIDRDSFRDDMEVSPGRTNTELKSDSTEYIALGEKTANTTDALRSATASGSAGTECPKMKDIQYHYMRLPTHTT